MTLHEIEDHLKRVEGSRAQIPLYYERMLRLSLEAQGLSEKQIAVSISRSREVAVRKNNSWSLMMSRAFNYDPVAASEIWREWIAQDYKTLEAGKPLAELCA